MSTSELLSQWREATRAAELAERLAKMALEAVERADKDAEAAEAIAAMALSAAEHADQTARAAREASDRAGAFARESRGGRLADADGAVISTRDEEGVARDRFHEAERAALERHKA